MTVVLLYTVQVHCYHSSIRRDISWSTSRI